MQLGFYHVYWKELTRLFPREQILLLQSQDLRDVNGTLDKVFRFLDLRKWNNMLIVTMLNAKTFGWVFRASQVYFTHFGVS